MKPNGVIFFAFGGASSEAPHQPGARFWLRRVFYYRKKRGSAASLRSAADISPIYRGNIGISAAPTSRYILYRCCAPIHNPRNCPRALRKLQLLVVVYRFGVRNLQGFPRGFPRRYFYCGKTTVIPVQAVTVIKHNYRYRATRYREKTHSPKPCKMLPRNS